MERAGRIRRPVPNRSHTLDCDRSLSGSRWALGPRSVTCERSIATFCRAQSGLSASAPTDRSALNVQEEIHSAAAVGDDIHGALPVQAPWSILWHGDADAFNEIAEGEIVVEVVEQVDA